MTDCRKCRRFYDSGCPYPPNNRPKNCDKFESLDGDEVPSYIG